MKTKVLMLVGFLLFAFGSVFAQKLSEDKVPQDVVISFKYKYSEATVISWEKDKDSYVVKFKLNDQVGRAHFDATGVWNITKYDVAEKELPSPILTYFKENYRNNGYVITTSELQKTSEGETNYFVEVKKEGSQEKPTDLTFDIIGKLLNKAGPENNKTVSTPKQEQKQKPEAKKEEKQPVKKEVKNQEEDQTTEVVQKPEEGDNIIDAAKVPTIAKTHFASKMKKATGVVWHFKDKIYTVKFSLEGQSGQSTYDKDGVWIETRVMQPEESLNQLTLTYLKDNFKTYKVKTVELVTTPKDKSTFIRMYDKRSKALPPPLTEIWFSTTGKLISLNKPDIDDPNAGDIAKRNEEKDDKFLSNVDQKGSTFENANNYNDKVDIKELPTPILDYIKHNYKDQTIRSSRLVSDDELGNIYFLSIWYEGNKYGTLLYFDLNGKFLKKIDESEGKVNNQGGNSVSTQNNNEPKSKYGTPEEKINPSELPASISKYLKKNFPQHTISESFFKTDTDQGNCYFLILKKSGDKKVVKLYFDLDGNMLKNETEN
ncbi:MAG: PepSY-like domain-containing protein [Bacteroidota bacterium]